MSAPVRLQKKRTRDDYMRDVNSWVIKNFGVVALATIITLLIAFIIVCYIVVGVSAVESGTMRNFIAGGV